MTEAGLPTTTEQGALATIAALLRVRQWVKNGFVLAPLFFSITLVDHDQVIDSFGATIIFCLVSSCVYILNDLRDKTSDQNHPTKRFRPIASGHVSPGRAISIAGSLVVLIAAFAASGALPLNYWLFVIAYVVINVSYSFGLRGLPLVDIGIVASGFVLRVLAGTAAISIDASQWIILSTGLIALLLVVGKRRADLVDDDGMRSALLGYNREFIDLAMGALAATTISFYALFTVSDYSRDRFGSPDLYLTTFWVVAGVLRYFQVVLVHGNYESPTDIVLNDTPLKVIIGTWLIAFYVLAYVVGNGTS